MKSDKEKVFCKTFFFGEKYIVKTIEVKRSEYKEFGKRSKKTNEQEELQ